MINISDSYSNLNDYVKALEYGLSSYEIRKQIFPFYSLDIAKSFSTLGSIFYFLRNYEKAVKCQKQTIQILTKIYPDLDEFKEESYIFLSFYLKTQGDIKSELIYELKLLELREKKYTRYHPKVSESCENIAILYSYLEEYLSFTTKILFKFFYNKKKIIG